MCLEVVGNVVFNNGYKERLIFFRWGSWKVDKG